MQRLHAAYKPPTRQRIAGPLLDEYYDKVKAIVDEKVLSNKSQYSINVVTDESTNVTKARISNISLHTTHGAFYWRSEDIESTQMTATNVASWLKGHLVTLSSGDLQRINSIATDTCPTMLSAWGCLRACPELRHVFCIPCDSHGIQLLIKDLLSFGCVTDIIAQAQMVAKTFKNSPLQLSRLRQYQVAAYGEKRTLCLSVITRWGTQYRLVKSVLRNKDALRQYALKHTPDDIGDEVYEYIDSRTFWTALECLRDLLQPIHEAQKMSESSKGHLGQVLERWKNILHHLKRMTNEYPELDEFVRVDGQAGTFASRYKRQVKPIHIVAFYLTPNNRGVTMTAEHKRNIFEFISEYASSSEQEKTMQNEFLYYLNQIKAFELTNICWENTDDPRIFWLLMRQETEIAQLAHRIFETPVNSVASEQAFSIQNAIHTKVRNRLLPERVDKIVYIYRNHRILKAISSNKREPLTIDELSEEEKVDLEDQILRDLEEDSSEEERRDVGTEADLDVMDD